MHLEIQIEIATAPEALDRARLKLVRDTHFVQGGPITRLGGLKVHGESLVGLLETLNEFTTRAQFFLRLDRPRGDKGGLAERIQRRFVLGHLRLDSRDHLLRGYQWLALLHAEFLRFSSEC